MLLGKEIEDFHDDGFEGSNDERHIFREIFFGNITDHTSKRCLVTGVINFECDSSKNTDASLCSNSENSALTGYSSSKNIYLENIYNVSDDFRENSAPGCSPDRLTFEKRNDEDVSVKRMKFSVDELPNTIHGSGKILNSSAIPKEIMSGMFCPATDSVCETVTFRLVESSRQGVTSSCYLLKQQVEMDRLGVVGDQDLLKCRLPGLDANDGKEAVVSKAIASPVSQESFATRLLIASPSVTVAEKSGSPLDAEEGPKLLESPKMDVSNISLKIDPTKDPRPLLQYHIIHLLEAAGWCVERRKRPSRRYMDTIYRTPEGRPIREFPKVWRLCGELLFEDMYIFMQENESKEWADISQFCSDLSDTLINIEEVMNHSETASTLACRWRLLDPFVTVVFIDRKIGTLRKGEVVKATQSVVIDKKKTDAVLASINSVKDQSFEKQASAESALTDFEENYNACFQQVVKGGRQSNNGADEFLTGASFYKADREGICFMETVNGMQNQYSTISGNKISSQDLTSLPPCGSESARFQSGSCLDDVLVTPRNCNSVVGGSGAVSPHQDSNTNSPSSDKQSSEHNVETPKEVAIDVSMAALEVRDELLGGQVTEKVESHLQGSLDDCPNCTSYCLLHSHNSEALQLSEHGEQEGGLCSEASKFKMVDTFSAEDLTLKRKMRRKSRKISEIKLSTLYQSDTLGTTSTNKADLPNSNAHATWSELKEDQEYLIANARNKGSHKNFSSFSSCHYQIEKKHSKLKKVRHNHNGSKTGKRKSSRCQIDDDDLLVSAIIKNKDFSPSTARYSSKMKSRKYRALRKLKSQKGRCRLLPRSLGSEGKHCKDGKWYPAGARTVLSWLIDAGAISLNDLIQYQNPKDDAVIKDGLVTRDGIICKCCSKVLTISEFKIHAGFKLNRPCLNLFMESGKPFTLCQLQAWSAEYKTRKSGTRVVQVDENDQNDDSCGLCGDGGELICCDNCPSTFHQACSSTQELPEGSWYCLNCTCRICGELVNDKEASSSSDALKCSQCEHKYHEACMKGKGIYEGAVSDAWFCGGNCQEVYSGLQSRVGFINHVADGFSWMLLRCIRDDQKVHSAQRLALKAECNSRLAVALTIMQECFLSMVDPRTGIDMIPQVLYNWGSDFARLNFHGFYSVVLEKDDILISVASIRVHGTTVAEMPLVATCSEYRRQGMCRRLLTAIEEMLISFKVEKLVISAIPNLVETWTEGFGFKPLEDNEKQSLIKINLMVFPGTVLLKKPLYENQKADRQSESDGNSPLRTDESTKGEPIAESIQKSEGKSCSNQAGAKLEVKLVEGNNLQDFEDDSKMNAIDVDTGRGDKLPLRTDESVKVGTCSKGECTAESVHQSDANSCRNQVFAKLEIELVEGKDLQEFEADCKMGMIDGDLGSVDTSLVGTGGLSTVGMRSGGEPILESVQQYDGDCCANSDGAEAEIRLLEGKKLKELKVEDEMEIIEFMQPADGTCYTLEVGAEMEIGLVDGKNLQESENGAEMEIIPSVKQSNGNCCTHEDGAELDVRLMEGMNMLVGEKEGSTLQYHFSNLSCGELLPTLEDSKSKMVSNVEFWGMYDETQLSLDEQPQKASELNEK